MIVSEWCLMVILQEKKQYFLSYIVSTRYFYVHEYKFTHALLKITCTLLKFTDYNYLFIYR